MMNRFQFCFNFAFNFNLRRYTEGGFGEMIAWLDGRKHGEWRAGSILALKNRMRGDSQL